MSSPVVVVPPAGYPVSMDEAKDHLRVTDDYENGVIALMIEAATAFLDGPDGILGRAILPQTIEETFDDFGADFRLRLGPVASLVSVGYADSVGLPQTVAGARLVTLRGNSTVLPARGASWPWGRDVVVRYVAGSSLAPAALKMAILLHVGALFQNREALTDTAKLELPLAYKMLITPGRRVLV